LGEDRPVPLIGFVKKMGGAREELVLCEASLKGVIAVADTGRIEDENRAEGRSVAGSLAEEISLDVVDDC
jgi:hypothetical protein